ncbi:MULTISPECIES: HEAT repeat domain-containing protein [Actinoplanes]|uniref:HEAT repeat domain-containing protein n=1 Tax=Actinoplanes TaxID=1865 RepID=UPI0006991CD2|nr:MULTISPECIES: HEAT repeat domain-containing protein [Actinoplanes]GLY00208.1 hypothetical protein Acsp01_05870 [Actinoplanes sp. NBRC 101535]
MIEKAADDGDLDLLRELINADPPPHDVLLRVLATARAWFGRDPATELRERLGAPDATVETGVLTFEEYLPTVRWVRAVAPDGRRVEVRLAHRAIVTFVEWAIGLRAPRDELLERALWSGDPESQDWSEVEVAISRRVPVDESAQWAAGKLSDPDPMARRFAAGLLHGMSFDMEGKACVGALRDRFGVESDGATLSSVIGAYANFLDDRPAMPELIPLARDPRVDVRCRVAGELMTDADGQPAEILAAQLGLTHDEDPTVRRVALSALSHGPADVPAIRELLALHLADDDRHLRAEAAIGLARRGDGRALEELQRLAQEDGYESSTWHSYWGLLKMLE